jgi:hypothetical protein
MKTASLTVRLTTRERKELDAYAARRQWSASEVARWAIRAVLSQQLAVPKEPREAVKE